MRCQEIMWYPTSKWVPKQTQEQDAYNLFIIKLWTEGQGWAAWKKRSSFLVPEEFPYPDRLQPITPSGLTVSSSSSWPLPYSPNIFRGRERKNEWKQRRRNLRVWRQTLPFFLLSLHNVEHPSVHRSPCLSWYSLTLTWKKGEIQALVLKHSWRCISKELTRKLIRNFSKTVNRIEYRTVQLEGIYSSFSIKSLQPNLQLPPSSFSHRGQPAPSFMTVLCFFTACSVNRAENAWGERMNNCNPSISTWYHTLNWKGRVRVWEECSLPSHGAAKWGDQLQLKPPQLELLQLCPQTFRRP